jgi:hydroxyacylglutathione hydrolase
MALVARSQDRFPPPLGRAIVLRLLILPLLLSALRGWCQLASGSLDAPWNEGTANCNADPGPPLEVHAYNRQTYILREGLCATFEAPFMYLLIGSTKALLIDTGDVADPKQAPLADTVMQLLPGAERSKLPLLVVHTHRHLDHRAGDGQFANRRNVRVVGYDLESVRKFYGFSDWPNGSALIDLGDRQVDVIPTPGHNETEVSFFDRNTGLLFSGDFLMPARLLVDDAKAYQTSAERLANFVRQRPVNYVLGGHIEMDALGNLFAWESRYHPHEHRLQLSKQDVLALPDALRRFNGFYSQVGNFLFIDSMRILIACAVVIAVLLLAMAWMLMRYLGRRRASQLLQRAEQARPSL